MTSRPSASDRSSADDTSKDKVKSATPNDGNADSAQGSQGDQTAKVHQSRGNSVIGEKTPDREAGQVHVEPDWVAGENGHDNDFGTGKIIYAGDGPEVVDGTEQGRSKRRDDVIVDLGSGSNVEASRREVKDATGRPAR